MLRPPGERTRNSFAPISRERSTFRRGVPKVAKRASSRRVHLFYHGLLPPHVEGDDGDRHAYAAASTLPSLGLRLDEAAAQRCGGGSGRGGATG